jgi:hypothetical protein
MPSSLCALFVEDAVGLFGLLMSPLLMFLASPQNTAVSAEVCRLSSRGMFIGNGELSNGGGGEVAVLGPRSRHFSSIAEQRHRLPHNMCFFGGKNEPCLK